VDRDEILHVLRAFEQAGLDYVLIGATAMAFHGVVRATEDIDLFIRATPDNVERLRQAFRAAYDAALLPADRRSLFRRHDAAG
jgi:predicted nucleotidyltransferase